MVTLGRVMSYRTAAPIEELRLSDRQTTWVLATTSVAEVTANLGGRSVVEAPSVQPDEIAQVTLWLGLPFLALGICVHYWTGDALGLILSGFGVPLLLVALVRVLFSRKRRMTPPRIELRTFVPTFETRTVHDHDDVPSEITYVIDRETHPRKDEIVWPSRLNALAGSLAPHERIKLAIIHRGTRSYIGWAYPL